MPHLKVISYNIHKGFQAGNIRFVLDGIRRSIQVSGAHIVFLQEVLGEGSARRDAEEVLSQFEFLADGVWPYFAYGKNAVYTTGHHGNAILSAYPIETWTNVDVSTNRYERRGLLHAILSLPDGSRLHAACMHLDLMERGRRRQIDQIVEYLRNQVDPEERLLLAGDTNDWRKRLCSVLCQELGLLEVHQIVNDRLAVSFPSYFPILSLDRIYFRNLDPVSAQVLGGPDWESLSDHLALTADFSC
jgi:endonuclease/exonuclease/phosphatase family metal-dependent hydrolase